MSSSQQRSTEQRSTGAEELPVQDDTISPAPLTSLSSLLGKSFEGGAACGADGTCD